MRLQKKIKIGYLKEKYDEIEKAICWSIDVKTSIKTDELIERVEWKIPGTRRKDILSVAEELRYELEIFYDAKRDVWLLTPPHI